MAVKLRPMMGIITRYFEISLAYGRYNLLSIGILVLFGILASISCHVV